MITVPEAARRVRKNPETIRRWIRAGKLPAHKVGTQHLIEEQDLDDAFEEEPKMLPTAPGRDVTFWGAPMPNVVKMVWETRKGH
jgi:excisionase family DNA binding protein